MAEILIRAKSHWMDNFTKARIDAMSAEERASRDARIEIGDIVVVRPDGWVWGREECLPTFIVVKLPGISVETVKKLEEALMAEDGVDERGNPKYKIAKRRKWKVPSNYMTKVINKGESVITITLSAQKLAFIENVIEKTLT